MLHYLKTEDGNLKVKTEMGCNHPKMKNNNTDSVGCGGECHECSHSIATCTIPEMLGLLKRAGCTFRQ